MRTADICSDCQDLLIERQFPDDVLRQILDILEKLRAHHQWVTYSAEITERLQKEQDNKQTAKGIGILKSYLRFNQGTYQSYKLLSLLYVDVGKLDRAHIHNAEALILQGRLEDGIARYERAKSITSSQDLFDILSVKTENLQQKIDLYKDLSN